MNTLAIEQIKIGQENYFSDLWDGNGGNSIGFELLQSGCIAIGSDVVEFKVVDIDYNNPCNNYVKVTDIY